MAKYIDKSAIKAELEKCYNECLKRAKIIDSEYWNAKADAYCNALVILDETTEVKEVDLEKEFDKCCENYIFDDECEVYTARHFFELGLKAKGE